MRQIADHWAEEDRVYRYYHQSFKVYDIQTNTEAIVNILQEVGHLGERRFYNDHPSRHRQEVQGLA
jgi:hypothetical protein